MAAMPDRFWNERDRDADAGRDPPARERAPRRADRLGLRHEPVLPGQAGRRGRPRRRDPARGGPRPDPADGEGRDRRLAGGRHAARRQPVRAARHDRPDPGHGRHDRPADAHRAHPPRHRRLRRDGRPGAVGDGLPARRHRVRVHELQPLRGRPVRPPDVRDARRGDHPVRGRAQRAAADDDGRARPTRSASGRRRPTRFASPRWPPSSASSRATSAFGEAISRARPGSRSRAIASASRRPGAWSRATSTGPASSGSTPANATSGDGVHFGGIGYRRGGADRSRVGRGPAVHRRPAGRGGLHLDPARGVAAAADAVARPDAGVHRAVPLRTDQLPVPDPRPVRRHVHRQGRERLPAGGPGGPDAARAAA